MRDESCGKCAPCALGSAEAHELAESAGDGSQALEEVLSTISMSSLCGFGREMPKPIREIMALLDGRDGPSPGATS
jgi:bidirectional [NiFe] hydrogenase diaphorase subunit